MAKKESDDGTREQRKGAVMKRMRKKKKNKVPSKTHSRLNIPCPVASSSLLYLSVHTAE